MTTEVAYKFEALRDRDDPERYPVKLPTRFEIRKDYCPTFVSPGDEDFDPERDTPYESEYISWGVWDFWTRAWAGKNDAASHFDTYGEAVSWFERWLVELAEEGKIHELLMKTDEG